jgi:MFS family permease
VQIVVKPMDRGAVRVAAIALVTTQIVMVAVMTMTPVHMRDHGHSLSATGFVISMHIAAMFLPSPLTGVLVDRFGRRPILAAGALVLLAAGLLAALADPDSMAVLTIALALLGLGWNLGLVGGTAMLTDATPLETRAGTQGSVDLAVALGGSTASLGSGVMVAATSYAALSVAGGVLGLAILPFLLREPRKPAAEPVSRAAGGAAARASTGA